MTAEHWLAIALFAFASSITPGPNNMMLLASGVNFGFRRTLPHMLGVALGFSFMLIAVGQGLSELFERIPFLFSLLRIVGIAYLIYLAWGIARTASDPIEGGNEQAQPMSFWGAVAFQWVNPKAWIMALSLYTTYLPSASPLTQRLAAAGLFTILNLPSVAAWAAFGAFLRPWLASVVVRRRFNYLMAALLLGSLFLII